MWFNMLAFLENSFLRVLFDRQTFFRQISFFIVILLSSISTKNSSFAINNNNEIIILNVKNGKCTLAWDEIKLGLSEKNYDFNSLLAKLMYTYNFRFPLIVNKGDFQYLRYFEAFLVYGLEAGDEFEIEFSSNLKFHSNNLNSNHDEFLSCVSDRKDFKNCINIAKRDHIVNSYNYYMSKIKLFEENNPKVKPTCN